MMNALSAMAISVDVCDAYADDLFELKAIARQIDDRANRGFRKLRVAQIRPLDLTTTCAAARLIKHLDELEYRYKWQQTGHYVADEDLRYPELEIFW